MSELNRIEMGEIFYKQSANTLFRFEGETGNGKYGFGLNKEWCEQRGVQPIRYVNESSKETEKFPKIFNAGLENLQIEEYSQMEFFDYILDLLRYTKPLKCSLSSIEKIKSILLKIFMMKKSGGLCRI